MGKLKIKIERLEAENAALREQHARVTTGDTLMSLWNKHSRKIVAWLLVEDANGERHYIEGYRGGDEDSSSALFGSSVEGAPWYHFPRSKKGDSPEWKLIEAHSERFYLRELSTGKILRGIGRRDGSIYYLNTTHGDLARYVSHENHFDDYFELIPDGQICFDEPKIESSKSLSKWKLKFWSRKR